MDFVAVEYDSRVLRYVHPVVHKVLGREVRRGQPERRVSALHLKEREGCEKREAKLPRVSDSNSDFLCVTTYLLDDGTNVRKALLVFRTRPIVAANHLVELSVGPHLDFWM